MTRRLNPCFWTLAGVFATLGWGSLALGWQSQAPLDKQSIQTDEPVNLSSERLNPEAVKFFESKIRPVLVRECYGCHSDQVGQVKGGLWLDTRDSLLTGGDSGPAVVPGNLEDSLMWSAINHFDYAMPPGRKLSDEVLADFRHWIEMGAPDPRLQKEPQIRSTLSDQDLQAGRSFWSFKKPELSEVPDVATDWPRKPIDHFVYDQLESRGLQPAPDTDPLTLLRRLSFDLIGLPPSPQKIRQFQRRWDRDPEQALIQTVDELLAQDQFGERWGRHWLDVSRYAESTGRELNLTLPYAWRYRDYVIDAFNRDKPYHEFVQQQIAGDLLPIDSDDQWTENLIATGFLTLGPKALRERNRRQFEMDLIDEQIDVTTRAFLGVSVACARCHDHKTDPIPQTDYYALAGIFKGMSTHFGTSPSLQNRYASHLVILPIDAPLPGDQPITGKELEQLRTELITLQTELRQLDQQRRQARLTGSNDENFQQQFARRSALSNRIGYLQTQIDRYDESGNPLSLCMAVQPTRPVDVRLLERGELNRPGSTVPRGFPQVLCETPPTISKDSTGRLELARWIGSSDNPLTARVMVNRVWQHLFGKGLVRTSDDFGATGESPSHPELLDYLAIEFMEQGWSVKQLIRSIVLSRSYRMSGQFNEDYFKIDPDNRYLWRMEPRRLEAEAIRDAMLFVAGNLDTKRPAASALSGVSSTVVRNGRIVPPNVPLPRDTDGNMRTPSQNSGRLAELQQTVNLLENQPNYRSVYLPVVRDYVSRSMEVFDFAETSLVVTKRETSHTPDQGLYLLNNDFVYQQAKAMARRIAENSNRLEGQLKQAFLLAYGRWPTSTELAAAINFFHELEVGDASSRSPSLSQSDRRNRQGNRSNTRFNRTDNRQETANRGTLRTDEITILKLTAVCQAIMASAEFRLIH